IHTNRQRRSIAMSFSIKSFEAKAGDRSGTAFELYDDAGTVRAEVWPMCGFNCLRWQVRQADGTWGSVLYTAPDWETNPVPTRSGHPILFPFPGRLRDGRLEANGQTYQLPLNDSTKQHAIHGFTPRNPWRTDSMSATSDSASIEGIFDLQHDLPSAAGLWPEFTLKVTYRLSVDRLAVDARVENRGAESLPFGLGYHPYFRLPGVADADVGGHVLQANMSKLWEADANNLPTGTLVDLPAEVNFRQPRPIGAAALDHIFTVSCPSLTLPPREEKNRELAMLSHPNTPGRLRIMADAAFRELVLFTPAHRQAVAIEPYTCSADASHLAARGIDSGWRTLAPGEVWQGRVEYRWERQ
ncbi:MAG TPA: aldose 1-epimerase, partial [Urbifossiella sp.]